ncbi:MAG TPA: hypothetical protein VFY71_02105 [Planctomycetota bacterium]|nr:hypothetical protein [Planctomycetota bacterium]
MGKKHPLDIFRTSGTGFDSASRERRTVMGRVVTSAPRATAPQAAAPAASAENLPPAVAALRARVQGATLGAGVVNAPAAAPARERVADPWATPRPLRPPVLAPTRSAAPVPPAVAAPRAPTPAATAAPRTRREAPAESAPRGPLMPASVNRVLLVCAFVMVGGLALWTLAASVGGPALKSASPTAAAQVFRIQAVAYAGTPAGQASAFSARDLLRRDFQDVDVVAWPTAEPNVFSRFDLVVGKADSEKALSDVLARLRGIKSFGGQKQPFKDASIVGLAGN